MWTWPDSKPRCRSALPPSKARGRWCPDGEEASASGCRQIPGSGHNSLMFTLTSNCINSFRCLNLCSCTTCHVCASIQVWCFTCTWERPQHIRRMHSRRLQAEIVNLPGETRAQALGVCSMMVMQLANDLPYFGLSVWATAQDCRNAGLGSSSSDEDCAADSFGVLSDIVNFATDFLVILASCQENFTAELPCTADSTDITSAALGLGSWALTVEHACNPFHNETEEVEYIEEEPLDQFIPLSRDR